jgi:hypothetical protein
MDKDKLLRFEEKIKRSPRSGLDHLPALLTKSLAVWQTNG